MNNHALGLHLFDEKLSFVRIASWCPVVLDLVQELLHVVRARSSLLYSDLQTTQSQLLYDKLAEPLDSVVEILSVKRLKTRTFVHKLFRQC